MFLIVFPLEKEVGISSYMPDIRFNRVNVTADFSFRIRFLSQSIALIRMERRQSRFMIIQSYSGAGLVDVRSVMVADVIYLDSTPNVQSAAAFGIQLDLQRVRSISLFQLGFGLPNDRNERDPPELFRGDDLEEKINQFIRTVFENHGCYALIDNGRTGYVSGIVAGVGWLCPPAQQIILDGHTIAVIAIMRGRWGSEPLAYLYSIAAVNNTRIVLLPQPVGARVFVAPENSSPFFIPIRTMNNFVRVFQRLKSFLYPNMPDIRDLPDMPDMPDINEIVNDL